MLLLETEKKMLMRELFSSIRDVNMRVQELESVLELACLLEPEIIKDRIKRLKDTEARLLFSLECVMKKSTMSFYKCQSQ